MITDINQLDLNKRYTYADYLTWQLDEMVELIRGKVFRMSPAPGRLHQEISSSLLRILLPFFSQSVCHIYHAPFDVRLPLPPEHKEADKISTVVQPDICVVCDESKLDDRGCKGAPDWIIEILSPGTSKKDLTDKYDIYEHSGVREYWIVHPQDATVIPYRLDEKGRYQLLRNTPFAKGESIPVGIFPELVVELEEVFGNLLTPNLTLPPKPSQSQLLRLPTPSAPHTDHQETPLP